MAILKTKNGNEIVINPAILRKMRETVIGLIKKISDLEVPTHYKITKVNELNANFKLTFDLKNATDQSLGERQAKVKKSLDSDKRFMNQENKDVFYEIFTAKSQQGSALMNNEIKLDLTEAYQNFIEIVEVEDVAVDKKVSKTEIAESRETVVLVNEPELVPEVDEYRITLQSGVVIRLIRPVTPEMMNHTINGVTLQHFLDNLCTIFASGKPYGNNFVMYEAASPEAYACLAYVAGNRDLQKPKISALDQSYKSAVGRLFRMYFLNEFLEEIDGQHGIATDIQNGIPIHFVIMPGWGLEEVITLNLNSTPWETREFVKSQVKLKNLNYIRFDEIMESYPGFGISTLQILIKGKRMAKNKKRGARDPFTSGEYIVTAEEKDIAINKLTKINMFKGYHKGYRSRNFVETILYLLTLPDYDNNHMVKALSTLHNDTFKKAGTMPVKKYLETMIPIYNSGIRTGSKLKKLEIQFKIS